MPGRLIVRRIPDFHADKHRAAGQDGLFDVWRFHAFFTTTDPTLLDTVTADKVHRRHAIIEQVHADLKNSALAHLPSGVFTANAAWLVLAVIAFNLTRAAAALTTPDSGPGDHRDRAPHPDPDPLPSRDQSTTDDHAPTPRLALADRLDPAQRPRRRPTRHRDQLTTQPATARPKTTWNTTGSEARRFSTPAAQKQRHHPHRPAHQRRSVDRGLP